MDLFWRESNGRWRPTGDSVYSTGCAGSHRRLPTRPDAGCSPGSSSARRLAEPDRLCRRVPAAGAPQAWEDIGVWSCRATAPPSAGRLGDEPARPRPGHSRSNDSAGAGKARRRWRDPRGWAALFGGYWRDPETTAASFTPTAGTGRATSGVTTSAGHLVLMGRKKTSSSWPTAQRVSEDIENALRTAGIRTPSWPRRARTNRGDSARAGRAGSAQPDEPPTRPAPTDRRPGQSASRDRRRDPECEPHPRRASASGRVAAVAGRRLPANPYVQGAARPRPSLGRGRRPLPIREEGGPVASAKGQRR